MGMPYVQCELEAENGNIVTSHMYSPTAFWSESAIQKEVNKTLGINADIVKEVQDDLLDKFMDNVAKALGKG